MTAFMAGRTMPLALAATMAGGTMALALTLDTDMVEQWRMAARWTARIGFPLFIIAFTASALVRLWPTAITRAIVARRRQWGLAFALTHTIHLGALLTYLAVSGEQRPVPTLIGGALGYIALLAMAATSNNASQHALGAQGQRLHSVGAYILWFIFTFSYAGRIMRPDAMMVGIIGV
ncbi:MAG: hypothetical protein ACKOUM_04995, partial [Sphingopyxis sp.]